VGANLLPAGLVLLWAAVQPGLTVDANIIFSGIITTLVNSLLLLPALLFVWSRAAAPRP
jgi:hypothetical protein